jgi:CheY-like chemotaxis protein
MENAEELPPRQAPAPTVLVVDDEEVVRDLVSRMLRRAGYHVLCAVHGGDGLRRLRAEEVDVLITDMLMPEMNGIELIEAVRQERPDVKVIAVSGVDSRVRHLHTAMQRGADAMLLKPVARADLVQTVEQVIAERREELQQNYRDQADRMRKLADEAPTVVLRQQLLDIAREYDALSDAARSEPPRRH